MSLRRGSGAGTRSRLRAQASQCMAEGVHRKQRRATRKREQVTQQPSFTTRSPKGRAGSRARVCRAHAKHWPKRMPKSRTFAKRVCAVVDLSRSTSSRSRKRSNSSKHPTTNPFTPPYGVIWAARQAAACAPRTIASIVDQYFGTIPALKERRDLIPDRTQKRSTPAQCPRWRLCESEGNQNPYSV